MKQQYKIFVVVVTYKGMLGTTSVSQHCVRVVYQCILL